MKTVLILLAICANLSTAFAQLPREERPSVVRPKKVHPLQNGVAFDVLLKSFLHSVYSNQNFDSLLFVKSSDVMLYLHNREMIHRFWNMGTRCTFFPLDKEYHGKKSPNTDKLRVFANKNPLGDRCQKAKNPDGVYFYKVSTLPSNYDADKDKDIPVPRELANLPKMRVDIIIKREFVRTFYFVQDYDTWRLLYLYDCDCSA